MYDTLLALRQGKVVEIEGRKLKMVDDIIEPGDVYVAERNTGPKVLTAKSVNEHGGYIHPTTPDYAFDICECVKVCET